VVGAAGPRAIAIVARLFTPRGGEPLAGRPDGAIVFGRWASAAAEAGEDVVVVRSGREAVEVHCHGGVAACESVIRGLEQLGAVRHAWPEWLRAGGAAETEVEAREALCRAGGPRAARILSRQLSGGLDAELVRIEGLLAAGQAAAAQTALDRLRRAARVGMRLTRPWRVVVAGHVNAGKSSLVNALAGHARSIVSPEPGTTRDLLETRLVLDGWELDLVDTAGLRDDGGDATDPVERAGIARAVAARAGADLVLHVVDGRRGDPPVPTARELLVASRADLVQRPTAAWPAGTLWTSAVAGTGIAALAAAIVRRLVPEQADDPELLTGAVPFTERQAALVARLAGHSSPASLASEERPRT